MAFISLLFQVRCDQQRKEQLTELITPIVIFSFLFLILALNLGYLIEDIDSLMRQQQIYCWLLWYLFLTIFMSVSYIPHLLARFFLFITISTLVVYRSSLGD